MNLCITVNATTGIRVSVPLTFSPAPVLSAWFVCLFATLIAVVLIVAVIFSSLMTKDVEHLFMCLSAKSDIFKT